MTRGSKANRVFALCGLALLGGGGASAIAQGAIPYLDDRSTPEAVVQSYYNAINRAEYSRAYSYFDPETAPQYDAWETGYSDTASVEVINGEAITEGAAGSIYYSLPVAIEATSTGHNEKRLFAGCYTLRLANPAIQGVPFRPMHIERATLEPAAGSLGDALPETCAP